MEKKIDNFVRKINELKKDNNLDLALGEDLSIALMNLISLEEHLMFSYMKTDSKKFLELLEQTREMRKKLLAKIVKKDDKEDYSEKWCMSKHLLAASMRLTEVGTKQLHDKKQKEAEGSFTDAFELYSMFWGLNGVGEKPDMKLPAPSNSKLSKLSQTIKKMLDCCKE